MKISILLNNILKKWSDEYHDGTRFGLKGKILHEEKSDFQKITICETDRYGKALLLNDCWMTAEYQEKQYHECLVHPALSSAEEIERILIIGGGDGGSARECLKYKEVKKVDLIEIDQKVIELSKIFLPKIGLGAWNDKRLNVEIENGINWVRNTKDNCYDVVIIDGSDPEGPAEGLFNKEFFRDCRRILKNNGVFAAQSESPESFHEIHIQTIKILREIFDYADPLYGNVPIYPSGWWSWTFAAVEKPRYKQPKLNRVQRITEECHIWSPSWQEGAFKAIPAFLNRELNQ